MGITGSIKHTLISLRIVEKWLYEASKIYEYCVSIGLEKVVLGWLERPAVSAR